MTRFKYCSLKKIGQYKSNTAIKSGKWSPLNLTLQKLNLR